MSSEIDKAETKYLGCFIPKTEWDRIKKYTEVGIFRNSTEAVCSVLRYLPQAAEERRLSLVAIEVDQV